jgi:replicative DNA helicase
MPLPSDAVEIINEEYSSEFYEKLIVKLLVTNSNVRDRLIPHLSDDLKVFQTPEIRNIISKIIKLYEEYKEFPSPSTIRMEIDRSEIQTLFNECISMDTKKFNEKHILVKIEEFFKQGMLFNLLSDAVSNLQENKFSDIAEITNQMKDTLSFTFEQECGLNLFTEKSAEDFYNYLHNKDNVISSSIIAFDEATDGGFHEKSLTIFAAEANKGKSAILCAIASNTILENNKVLYVTLEMNENKIAERIVANLFDSEINNLKNLTKNTFLTKFESLIKRFQDNCIIKEYPARSLTANGLSTLLKEIKMKQNFDPAIVLIDYLGLMIPIRLKKDENTYSEQKRCSEEVRAVAMEVAKPFVSAQQLNRGSFGSTIVGMSGLADSIGVSFTADVIVIATQSLEQKENSIFSWTIVKSRYGCNDLRMSVGLDMPKMKLYNVDNAIENLNKDIDDPSRETNSSMSEEDSNKDLTNFLNSRRKTL